MQTLDNTLAQLEEAKLRWMNAGLADVLQDGFSREKSASEGQLRLLAQAALFRQTCLRPKAPQTLEKAPKLPKLALPLLPEALRPSFRLSRCFAFCRFFR